VFLVRLVTPVVWAAAAGCLCGAAAGWAAARLLHTPQLDQLEAHRPALTTRLYSADDQQIASFARERRIELRSHEIPDYLKLAIVAIEDAGFYDHGGVQPKAILRAALTDIPRLLSGHRPHGGSTVTQQLALNLFLTRDYTIARKIREALLAIDMEKRHSKDQILTMYSNIVPLGHGAYGAEAASRLYFGISASDLSLAQCALLAGMIQSPNNLHDPIGNPDGALRRRDRVLDRMLALGFIGADAHRQATQQPIEASLHRRRLSYGAHFVESVRRQIARSFGDDALYTSGLEIRTTLDPELQLAAERAVREGLVDLDMRLGYRRPLNVVEQGLAASAEDYTDQTWHRMELHPGDMVHAVVDSVSGGDAQLHIGARTATLPMAAAAWTRARALTDALRPGDRVLVRLPDPLPEGGSNLQVELLQEPGIEAALLALDNRTGEVLAMVGGFDFSRSQYNCATQAARQCGSAFKPFVLLTAFQQGYTPADTLFDAPFLLPDATGRPRHCPRNYNPEYYGITTLRRALEFSYNATAVKLQHLVGGEQVIDTARRFGITSALEPYASLALGSFEVHLLDLVRAYAGIANLGELPTPFLVREIRDRNGYVLERTEPRLERALPAPVAYLAVHVMRGVIERGSGSSAASLGASLAGKTGTTDDHTDAWFVGFSPRITVGVWVGHRDGREPIGPGMSGSVAALPIWQRFMSEYLDSLDEANRAEDFQAPAGVVFAPVDWRTGLRATPECNDVILDAFLDGTEPLETYDPALHRAMDEPWPFQQPFYQARPGEPMPSPEAIRVADQRLRDLLR